MQYASMDILIDECAKKGMMKKIDIKFNSAHLVNAKYIAAAIEHRSNVIVCGL